MGCGLILIMLMPVVLIVALVKGIQMGCQAWKTTLGPTPRRVLSTAMRFCTPFVMLLACLAGLLVSGTINENIRGVDFGGGDYWQVPLGKHLELSMIDDTEQAAIYPRDHDTGEPMAAGLTGFKSWDSLVVAKREAVLWDTPSGQSRMPRYYLFKLENGQMESFADFNALQSALGPERPFDARWDSPYDFYNRHPAGCLISLSILWRWVLRAV